MKDALLKVVQSPKVRAAAVALVLAVAAAFGLGCGASPTLPPLPPEVGHAASVGLCANALLANVDPEQLTLAELRELAAALQACGKPAHVGDAGP